MFFNEWLDILLYKKKPASLAGTDLVTGIKHLVISGIILGLLEGIYTFLSYEQTLAAIPPTLKHFGALTPKPDITSIIVSAIGTPIGNVILLIIGGAVLWVIAKILGGKGSYGNFAGTLGLIQAAIQGTALAALTVIGILAALAGQATTAATITGIIGLIVILYWIYLVVRATQAVHSMSAMKAVVVVIVVPVIIAVILALVIGAAIISMLSGLGATTNLGTGSFPLGA